MKRILVVCMALALSLVASAQSKMIVTLNNGLEDIINVSTVKSVSFEHFVNGHKYVDLGLSVMWATCNVGATTPEGYGEYFAWGETMQKSDYSWSTYKWCNGTYNTLTKYCTSSSDGTVDNKTILELTDDAARANWGDNWRMPTCEELIELRANCYWEYTRSYNNTGVGGYIVYKVKSDSDKGVIKNDHSSKKTVGSYSLSDPYIFLPVAGYCSSSSLKSAGYYGYYRPSSPLYGRASYFIDFLMFHSGETIFNNNIDRCYGCSVRAVCSVGAPSTPTCFFSTSSHTLKAGETYSQKVTTNSDGAVTYKSSSPSVATVDASTGEVTAVSEGNATITANVAATSTYASASASYNIIVIKATPTCSFSRSSHALNVGETYTQKVTTNSNGAVTYTSSNPSVATVDASTGKVTAVADGNTTITATVAATSTYASASAAYNIIVVKATTPEYVDLGLSVKWATCNVGATTPEGYGDYFAWGETEPKSDYSWSTYFDSVNGSDSNFKKYATNKKTTLELSDDVAHVNWGGTWRMPTPYEQSELHNKCTWNWTTKNGVKGYKVKSMVNGNSIFLPAAGRRYGTNLLDEGSYGYYWSGSLSWSRSCWAWYVSFYSGNDDSYDNARDYGFSVRPVCP